jgi:coenzyme F420 biosynthesis associated uncharacterized protein
MTTLDRNVASAVGRALCGDSGPPESPPPIDLIGVCDDAAPRITAYARLEPGTILPPPEWIGRGSWIDMNVESLAGVIEPGLAKTGQDAGPLGGVLRMAAGPIAGAEAGIVTGMLAQRVMGQVDPGLLRGPDRPPTRLVLIAPNLEAAATKLDVDYPDLLRWVVVHELTHAVQFTAVPWLRDELERLLRELIGLLDVRIDLREAVKMPSLESLQEFIRHVRSGEVLRAIGGEEAAALLDRVQALMSLVEGHAEHVMDAVGAEVVEDVEGLRAALDARREERGAIDTFVGRLLGMDEKLRQYGEGKAFCDAVVASGGADALRTAWNSPAAAPTLAELRDPSSWLARTR